MEGLLDLLKGKVKFCDRMDEAIHIISGLISFTKRIYLFISNLSLANVQKSFSRSQAKKKRKVSNGGGAWAEDEDEADDGYDEFMHV